MKRIFFWLSFLLSLVFVSWPLFRSGYFTHHDNIQIIRIFEMRRCILDLQIPCRWVPDMGYGYGFPLFNYYAPSVYYLGAILSFALGYIGAAKMLFFLSFVVGFLGMFVFSKLFFGFWGALVSSVLFTYAPYRALDVYVRGALSEIFAISVFPLVLYYSYQLLQFGRKRHFVGLVISLSFFLITHNVMVMLFLPVAVLFFILMTFLVEKKSRLISLFVGLVLSFGLSSFFVLPAFLEKNLVQIESMIQDELNFRAHFVKVGQLFWIRDWYYGASQPQQNETISFQVGWPHWWLVAVSIPFLLRELLKRGTKVSKTFWIALLAVFVFIVSVFMTHNKSAFIWEKMALLSFAQFPWRFLSLAIFSSSLVGGYLLSLTRGNLLKFAFALIVLLAIVLNWRYFRPERFLDIDDVSVLGGAFWEEQQKGSVRDYLPKGAKIPSSIAPTRFSIDTSDVVLYDFDKSTKSWKFSAKVDKELEIEIPVFDFPYWSVRIGDSLVNYKVGENGLMRLKLPRGEYIVQGVLQDTTIRRFSNFIFLFSLTAFLYLLKNGKSFKIFR